MLGSTDFTGLAPIWQVIGQVSLNFEGGLNMKKKDTKKSNKRDERLSVRLSKTEKKRLTQEAESHGCKLSDYARTKLVKKPEKNDKMATCVTMFQELVNHVREKYGNSDDKILEEMVEKIWEILL